MHPDHLRRIVQRVRKAYLDENGSPYSWYAAAAEQDQASLRRQIDYRDSRFKALRAALADLKQIGEFCQPLLTRQLDVAVDVNQARYIHQPYEQIAPWVEPFNTEFPVTPVPPLETPTTRPKGPAQKRSLLEAALHNFEGVEEVGPYDALTLGPRRARILA